MKNVNRSPKRMEVFEGFRQKWKSLEEILRTGRGSCKDAKVHPQETEEDLTS